MPVLQATKEILKVRKGIFHDVVQEMEAEEK